MKDSKYILLLFLLSFGQVFAQKSDVHKLINQHRYKEALSFLNKENETTESLRLKALSYEKLFDYSNAIISYKKIVDTNPSDLDALINLAEAYDAAGNDNNALKNWITIQKLEPENPYFQLRLTQAYYKAGLWNETISSGNKVLSKDSISTIIRWIGDAYRNKNDIVNANYYYTKAIEKNPSDYRSLARLSDYFYSLGEQGYDTLYNVTNKYLTEIDSTQTTIGQFNGMALYGQGKFPEAIDRFAKNIALGDSSYTTLYYLGMSNFGYNHFYQAKKWLEKAYEINNKDMALGFYYASALIETKDNKKGLSIMSKILDRIEKIEDLKSKALKNMAVGYSQSGDLKNALSYYQKVYSIDKSDVTILYDIARMFDNAKDYNNALMYYQRLMKTRPEQKPNVDPSKKTMKDYLYENVSARIEVLKKEKFFKGESK